MSSEGAHVLLDAFKCGGRGGGPLLEFLNGSEKVPQLGMGPGGVGANIGNIGGLKDWTTIASRDDITGVPPLLGCHRSCQPVAGKHWALVARVLPPRYDPQILVHSFKCILPYK
jgi:hypothetical protein